MVHMGGELTGQIALVTGGAGALGSAAAALLAGHGASVVVADLRARVEAAPAGNGTPCADGALSSVYVDVRDRASVAGMFTRLAETHGVPHIVLCNAGVVHNAHFLEVAMDDWEQTLAVNLTGAFHVAQEAARRMVAAGIAGRIVLMGSWVQDVPWADGAAYCTSKAGLKMLARCMARDLARYGIRVNVVAPGIVGAGLSRRVMDEDPQFRQRAARVIPLGDLQTAEQVAQAVLWACLPASDYMTGATLLVDGGCSLFYFE
jgi:NAD(P)-dependent dehydrogenase (short-subunit alcohol dehydrogenase family)